MADRTPIEWADATWNPLRGCTRVSAGCINCYAEVMAARFSGPGQWGEGLATIVRGANGTVDHRWTGKVVLAPRHVLIQPMRWRRPRRIFVNSTSDLFHESVPDEWIDQVFAVMALCPQHTFMVLTKRPERMQAYLSRHDTSTAGDSITNAAFSMNHVVRGYHGQGGSAVWPLPNVWLGTSIEDQATADARIPHLLATPAAVRFISAEPLLGPVDLTRCGRNELGLLGDALRWPGFSGPSRSYGPRLDLVIVGGESGPGARVWDGFEDACRSLRDQCHSAGVAFFMKQMAGARKSAMPPIPDDLMVRQMPGVRA